MTSGAAVLGGASGISLPSAAQAYAGRGWAIFPVRPRAKDPIIRNGFLRSTTDASQIRAWWRAHPYANIGFVPGRAGLLVIDIDSEAATSVARKLGLFSEPTLATHTPRGGHLCFQHPGGSIGNRKLAGVLDVRADRGYVLLPPSVHPSGHIYLWAAGAVDALPLPPLAMEALQRPRSVGRAPVLPPIDAGTLRRRRYVEVALLNECLEVAGTTEGNRNNRLNEAAFSLARFVATDEVDAGRLIEMLTYAAQQAGLEDWEIERTIASAFSARGVPA